MQWRPRDVTVEQNTGPRSVGFGNFSIDIWIKAFLLQVLNVAQAICVIVKYWNRAVLRRHIDDAENGNDDGVAGVEHRPQNVHHDCKFKNSADDLPNSTSVE